MDMVDTIKDKADETLHDVKKKAKKMVYKAGDDMSDSCNDWLDYVKEHPVQSILFGIIGYFAIKGVLK
jgi:ElaB/YqjD/DUF883 family membrane-anchored ribosome-binding protein